MIANSFEAKGRIVEALLALFGATSSHGLARCALSSPWLSFPRCPLTLSSLSHSLRRYRIPSSGAHYHWVALLAPRPTQKFLSFFVGWLTVICWQFAVTSIGFQAGSLLGALVSLVWPEYVSVSWHAWLFLWAVLLLVILGNTIASTYLPRIMVAILVLHILGFFAMLIPMVSMSSHYSASDVFTTFLNEGGWSSQGLSFWIGLLGNVFAFLGKSSHIRLWAFLITLGADGAIHVRITFLTSSTV